MGSWNHTCAISNISITPETDVALFFVSETIGSIKNANSISENATPISFPIFCTYKYYGKFTPLESESYKNSIWE